MRIIGIDPGLTRCGIGIVTAGPVGLGEPAVDVSERVDELPQMLAVDEDA